PSTSPPHPPPSPTRRSSDLRKPERADESARAGRPECGDDARRARCAQAADGLGYPAHARGLHERAAELLRVHGAESWQPVRAGPDRKSTRLNSSHQIISYAV